MRKRPWGTRLHCWRKARTCWTWARRAHGPVRGRAEAGSELAAALHPSDKDRRWGPPGSAEEEQARLLPVLEGILKARPEAMLSVDTYKAATARAALAAGAEIINDVSGFRGIRRWRCLRGGRLRTWC